MPIGLGKTVTSTNDAITHDKVILWAQSLTVKNLNYVI
jgi:hypothetical protein